MHARLKCGRSCVGVPVDDDDDVMHARLKCGRSCVGVPVGLNQRL
jgi:hypothetical protein